jgi:hypothetical protein
MLSCLPSGGRLLASSPKSWLREDSSYSLKETVRLANATLGCLSEEDRDILSAVARE